MSTPVSENRPPLTTIREVKEHTFIFEKSHALPLDICGEMIRRFEANHDEQYPGRIGQTVQQETSIKRSTDLVVSGKEHWKDIDRELFRSLGQAIHEFREAYPFFKGPFKDSGYAIQRTRPGEFYHWHIDGGSHEFSERQLVAVWYLNDVPGPGGATEFSYQDVQVRPEAGKQRVRERIAGGPLQAPEAARVVESQTASRVEPHLVVIVRLPGRVGRHNPQASRHAEVSDQCSALEIDQQVLSPAAHIAHVLARQFAHKRMVHWPAQAVLAKLETGDPVVAQRSADAAAGNR